GATGDQDQAAGQVGQLGDDLGEEQLLDGADLVVDGSEGQRHGIALIVGVDAIAADAGDFVGEVVVAVDLEFGPALLVDHFLQQAVGAFRGDDREVGGLHDGVNAEHGGQADVDVNVRSLGRHGVTKNVVK